MLQRLGAGASQQAGNSSHASRRGSFAAPRPRALPHHCALLTAGTCCPSFPLWPAGKSAVLNALLGQKYLAEGILPTTNEINVLKHADASTVLDQQQQVCRVVCW